MFRRFFTPTRITVTSFSILATTGTLLLLLPWVTVSGKPLGIFDALFIATSATCVTGLSTVDVSREFTFFGQFILLVLMQIGGVGLMTFTTALYFWLGQRMSITEKLTLEENLLPNSAFPIKAIVRYVVTYTLIAEAIGAILLFMYWTATARFAKLGDALWFSIFHSVSAFTNGSIALFSNSLIDFQGDYFVIGVITSLIICGGLGFVVVFELSEAAAKRVSGDKSFIRLSVQTKLTLVSTVVLLAAGTLVILALERYGAFASLSGAQAVANAYFFSVVPRTAGFNTVPMTDFGGASVLVMMILMFIGAAPGSTGGGIKATTFGLLVAYTFARFRGKTQLNLWNRTIPQTSIDKATAVVVASATTVLAAATVLMISETYGLSAAESRNRLMPILFETLSAFGTVGLSLDFTPQLSEIGKLVLTVVMFVGRVGAITLALAISLNQRPEKFSYAEENIMIG